MKCLIWGDHFAPQILLLVKKQLRIAMLFLSFPSFLFLSFLLHYRQPLFLFDIKIPFCPSNSSPCKETVEDCFGVFVFSFLPFLLHYFTISYISSLPIHFSFLSRFTHTAREREREEVAVWVSIHQK
jgi:hypothetical protein